MPYDCQPGRGTHRGHQNTVHPGRVVRLVAQIFRLGGGSCRRQTSRRAAARELITYHVALSSNAVPEHRGSLRHCLPLRKGVQVMASAVEGSFRVAGHCTLCPEDGLHFERRSAVDSVEPRYVQGELRHRLALRCLHSTGGGREPNFGLRQEESARSDRRGFPIASAVDSRTSSNPRDMRSDAKVNLPNLVRLPLDVNAHS